MKTNANTFVITESYTIRFDTCGPAITVSCDLDGAWEPVDSITFKAHPTAEQVAKSIATYVAAERRYWTGQVG
jgi:hypothetical protein